MEAKTEKNTSSKKFSFRRRRSSKGTKESEQQPVAFEDEKASEAVSQNSEQEKVIEVRTPEISVQDENAAQSCGEGESPSLKTEDSPSSEGKKKSKRRSLFKRSGKKGTEVVDEVKGIKEKDQKGKDGAGTKKDNCDASDVKSNYDNEQVFSEGKSAEVTDQSDGEGYLTGEQSEAEAGDGEVLAPESKKSSLGSDKGTKQKRFFKRGLSLKRKKNKKQTPEVKEESVGIEQEEEPIPTSEPTDSTEADLDEEKERYKTEIINDEVRMEENLSNTIVPLKLPRKVSFVGPDGNKLSESSDNEDPTPETCDESDGDTVIAEDDPNELLEVVIPQVVVMSEDVGISETPMEGEDDDLTEVSSINSSLLASSDAPDSTSDRSRCATFTDTDDAESRTTLEGISEESQFRSKSEPVAGQSEIFGETSGDFDKTSGVSGESSKEFGEPSQAYDHDSIDHDKVAAVSKPEVEHEESESKLEETGFESRPENIDLSESTKLLGDDDASKIGEQWEMINKSYDMSVELNRVKKQTLFNVKRLCCSVM